MAPLLLPLLLFPVQLLLAVADAFPDSCNKDICGSQNIHYPFWLSSSTPDCGYQGIGLVCENNSTLILPFKSHRYRVFSIDYKDHTVRVSDADIDEYAGGCPRLRLNLTVDTTWLQLTPSDSNITFLYNCKKSITLSSAVELSGCQAEQDGNRSYLLRDMITGAEAYQFECEEVVVAPVLDTHKKAIVGAPGGGLPLGNGSFNEVLQGGFELNYNTHSQECDRCEGSGGWCGYERNDGTHAGGMMSFTCYCESGPTTDQCGAGTLEPKEEFHQESSVDPGIETVYPEHQGEHHEQACFAACCMTVVAESDDE